ncbi:hypothetical protein F8237_23405 [Bradyrhizobium betae]|uniref:Uncharacterized protein n=1 Tax=Bradyrhizobium betae TaxID=244734 RepID=A0A5P6P9W4_9BRAD|nr:hypothetical protein F8237_23405 [Bradyrhizobium betae]
MPGCGNGSASRRRRRDPHSLAPHSTVIARLDRAIQYAAASPYPTVASGILDPRPPCAIAH